MRAFTILSFIAVASAGNGYFYCKPGTTCQTSSGTSGSIGGIQSDVRVLPAESGLDYVRSSGAVGVNYGSSGGYVQPVASRSGNYFGFNTGLRSNAPIGRSEDQSIGESTNKEFYSFSAPNDDYADEESARRVAASIKMKLRVVFIKAPEYNAANRAALQVAKQAIQERTHIYVLSRQPDVSELVTEVQMLSESFRQKPEVKFIKYRTPQDAVNAQHLIQQQYEAMGGSSRSINGGVAPVLNYASAKSGFTNNGFANNGFANNGFANNGFANNGFVNNGFVNKQGSFGKTFAANNNHVHNGFANNGFANNGLVNNGFIHNGFTKDGTFGKTFTAPAVVDLPNQGQVLGEYVTQIQRNQFGQAIKPQAIPAAQQFNQQQFSYHPLPGSSSIAHKGAAPAVSFSSVKEPAANAADQSNKEREETETFIYVLSKEPNIEEVVDKFRELTEAAKLRPEVRFVKYKTPQEAIDAQQFIQQQYDALGGSSTSDI